MRGLLALSLALLLGRPAQAGTDAQAIEGIAALERGELADAVAMLEEALADPVTVKRKRQAEAWLALGSARLRLWQAAAAGGQPDPEEFVRGPERALVALERAMPLAKGRLEARIEAEARAVALALVQLAALGMRSADASPDPTRAWAEVARQADLALRADPEGFQALQVRGQALQRLGRAEEALLDYRGALERFTAHPPTRPDPTIGTTAWLGAGVLAFELGKGDEALALIERGRALVEAETARGGDAGAAKATFLALDRLRAEILAANPERRLEALATLEEALAASPGELPLLLALAGLLEEEDQPRAIALYQEAAQQAPERPEPPFLLGALYYEAASRLANEEQLVDPADDPRIRALLDLARPCFEASLALDPAQTHAIEALIALSKSLGDDTAAALWEAALAARQGGG